MIKNQKERGSLLTHNLRLEPHEVYTLDFLLSMGKRIELVVPSLRLGSRNPDFWMDGLTWEMKSPIVAKSERLAVLLHKAAKQSCNVIFDLRRLSSTKQWSAIRLLQRFFSTSRTVKQLWIISDVQRMEILRK